MTDRSFANLTVVDHPLVADRITRLRDGGTEGPAFRRLTEERAALLAYEASRDLPVAARQVQTPLASCPGVRLEASPVIVPILRAGLGMVPGVARLFPEGPVGHLGMYRDEETLKPVPYYAKLPEPLTGRPVFLLDPMLATGGSALMALEYLQEQGAGDVRVLCLVAAPEGVRRLEERFPEVPVWTAALDGGLNDRAYIVPGLGDAGDRLFGTG